jgi:MoxR-like ATPase
MEAPTNCWEQADFAMVNGCSRLLLYGVPGTGKTFYGLNYHKPDEQKSYRLICTEEMTDGDIIGSYKQQDDGIWRLTKGVALKAWEEGARLVVDEINRVNGDVESRLMSIIDSQESASWEHPDTGEVFYPKQAADYSFSVIATMNGEPDDLAPAILDRLVVRVNVDAAHPDGIDRLPEHLRRIAREATGADATPRYSLRSFLAFDQMFQQSRNLEASALLALPRIAEQVVDALVLTMAEKR